MQREISKPKPFEGTVQESWYTGKYWHPLKPSPLTCRLACTRLILKMGVIWKPRGLVRFDRADVASLKPLIPMQVQIIPFKT